MLRRTCLALALVGACGLTAFAGPHHFVTHAKKTKKPAPALVKLTGVPVFFLGEGSNGPSQGLVDATGEHVLAALDVEYGSELFDDVMGKVVVNVYGKVLGKVTLGPGAVTVPLVRVVSAEGTDAHGKTWYAVAGAKGGNDETGQFWEDFQVAPYANGDGKNKVIRDYDGGEFILGKALDPAIDFELDLGAMKPGVHINTPGATGAMSGAGHP